LPKYLYCFHFINRKCGKGIETGVRIHTFAFDVEVFENSFLRHARYLSDKELRFRGKERGKERKINKCVSNDNPSFPFSFR